MPAIERSITLNVPVEMAFRYLFNPTHLPEICPSIIEVSDVQHHTGRSTEFEWIFKMIGVRFEGGGEITDTRHNQQLDMHFWGGIRGNLTCLLQPVEDGVRLEMRVDYTLPAPLLHKHAVDTIIQSNEHTVECMLTSMKIQLEALREAQHLG
jgi:uncharacterized membrane protein